MDFIFIGNHIDEYVVAAFLVLRIAAIGICLSLIIGIVIAAMRHLKVPFLSGLLGFYISFGRNTPLLLQLFFLYFGLPKIGIVLSAEHCAIIGLSFLGSAYMAEAVRSGIESIDQIQHESAKSLGMTSTQSMVHIILPQALTVALPALSANVIFLIKETSVFSAIALADFLYVAKELIGIHYMTAEALFMLVVSYTLLLAPLSLVSGYLERRWRFGLDAS